MDSAARASDRMWVLSLRGWSSQHELETVDETCRDGDFLFDDPRIKSEIAKDSLLFRPPGS